jgi:NAD(P)-dependent dehydrogenase (short-subunit alcohol dehydrogenase family)
VTLDLKGKKVVVTGGKHSVERAIAEAVAQKGADVVIWLRKWNDDGNEAKALPITELEIRSQRPNGASPHKSLWRQSMGRQILLVTSITRHRRLRAGHRLTFSE